MNSVRLWSFQFNCILALTTLSDSCLPAAVIFSEPQASFDIPITHQIFPSTVFSFRIILAAFLLFVYSHLSCRLTFKLPTHVLYFHLPYLSSFLTVGQHIFFLQLTFKRCTRTHTHTHTFTHLVIWYSNRKHINSVSISPAIWYSNQHTHSLSLSLSHIHLQAFDIQITHTFTPPPPIQTAYSLLLVLPLSLSLALIYLQGIQITYLYIHYIHTECVPLIYLCK